MVDDYESAYLRLLRDSNPEADGEGFNPAASIRVADAREPRSA
jgi:hypothetical protein